MAPGLSATDPSEVNMWCVTWFSNTADWGTCGSMKAVRSATPVVSNPRLRPAWGRLSHYRAGRGPGRVTATRESGIQRLYPGSS